MSSYTFSTAVRCHVGTVQLRYGATSAPYSYGTVPHWHRTATVRSRPCTLYTEIVTVDRRRPAKENVRQSRSPYSSCTGRPGTVQQLYGDTDDRKNKTRPVEADPIVVKTLGTVLCSSRDGVPLKLKKENCRPGNFKIPIN